MKYNADGPAVMLGESTSLFPKQLAAYWRSKGLDVVLVTQGPQPFPALPDGTRVVSSREHESRATRAVTRRIIYPALAHLERLVPRFRDRFTRITGVSGDSELRLPFFAEYISSAWPTYRAAKALQPRFVFGHEVTTYGLPTALCRGVPRIVFPWGGDVFTYAESSPFHFALTRFCLQAVDLIVPSSTTAARHICSRFKVAPEKVIPVSWGVDRTRFKRAEGNKRREICARWKIDPGATVVLNPRRFRPAWGAFVALEAFMRLADECPQTHFILFGGLSTESLMETARSRLEREGLLSRFTLLWGNAPLEVCAELMSVSDVFVSLLGRGDMRSASVVQAAAAGGVPVITDLPEYREMERLGFSALFVRPDDVDDVLSALRLCLDRPEQVADFAARNQAYISEHENHKKQMDRLLNLIDNVCSDYDNR